MDTVELAAIEEIKQLKARYFRCMDTKDWVGFAAVFAPDAEMDMRGEAGPDALVRGNEAIAAFVRRSVDAVTTVHHGHMPEIRLTGADTAEGIWAMEDVLRWPDGAALVSLHGYGHYHDRYVRTGEGWRIAATRLTRLRVDVVTPPPAG